MRILFITQWFDPEPTIKGLLFARELVERGFDVEVITGYPNYPGGVIYPGYRVRLLQREILDGVFVTRLPIYPSHNKSPVLRILNYVSFGMSSFLYGLFFARGFDVIYAYHPPLTVGVVAVLLRLLKRIPVVYDIQDMWPDTLRATGMIKNLTILKLIENICLWVYRNVDQIVVLSPGFKRLLVERGVPNAKIDVIYNWANEALLLNSIQRNKPSIFEEKDKFYVAFAGNMGKAQNLDVVLDAANILKKSLPKVCFVMIGGGVELSSLKIRAQKLDLVNVVFIPAVPMSEVGAYIAGADILLVHLQKDPLFTITIPSKVQAYMSVGKAQIMALEGDAEDLIKASGGGVVVEPGNALALAEKISIMSKYSRKEMCDIGEKAKIFYDSSLSLDIGVSKFSEIFKRIKFNKNF